MRSLANLFGKICVTVLLLTASSSLAEASCARGGYCFSSENVLARRNPFQSYKKCLPVCKFYEREYLYFNYGQGRCNKVCEEACENKNGKKSSLCHGPGSYECIHFYNHYDSCYLYFLPKGLYRYLYGDIPGECAVKLTNQLTILFRANYSRKQTKFNPSSLFVCLFVCSFVSLFMSTSRLPLRVARAVAQRMWPNFLFCVLLYYTCAYDQGFRHCSAFLLMLSSF